ncbi:MAG: patatin-like phospholipase family protein [Gammaproteobacteria bacterium]|nr:patatin-like phospholipase family protein [Gammaproteobacteria bacterium]
MHLIRMAGPLLVGFLLTAMPANAQTGDPAAESRPRIGLVLGGGGAKGAAHVGVLRVLEDLRIPIHCVAGTSMGALVGGTFASGMAPEQIESNTLAIDWSRTVGSEGRRDRLPINRKLSDRNYTNAIELGFKAGKIRTPGGFLKTQDIEDLIRDLITDARLKRDFDDLPIPFRAVATDMVTGDMVVMRQGDLSVAMRASMAIPGAFSPIVVGDQVLSDGGMTRNIPVDVARDLCADVVIVVWMSSPQPSVEELESALSLVSRSMDVMIETNEKAQLAMLTDRDVEIEVPMGDITAADFERAPEAVELGKQAALRMAASLSRYSLPEDEYLAWQASVGRAPRDASRLAEVRIVGLERVSPGYVKAQLVHSRPGAIVDTEQINEDANRIFALGDFSGVEYHYTGPPGARVLEISPIEKAWGPNFLKFDIGLDGAGNGELQAIVRGEHSRTWMNSRGARWNSILQVGKHSIVRTDFYQPIDSRQRFFVQPIAMLDSRLEDIYFDGNRVARYFLRDIFGKVDLGANIGRVAQLRAGVRTGWIRTKRDTGDLQLPELEQERDSAADVSLVYDTRDNVGLPTRGSLINARYVNAGTWLGGEQKYELIEGVASHTFSLRGNALTLLVGGGKELSGDLPPTRDFRLGGIRSFPGLRPGELRGSEYWLAGGGYLWKLADLLALWDQSLYAGLRLQAGHVRDRRDQVSEGTLYGISGSVSGRTPVGPLRLSLGYVDNDSWQLQFSLGRPIAEGSAIDDVF